MDISPVVTFDRRIAERLVWEHGSVRVSVSAVGRHCCYVR